MKASCFGSPVQFFLATINSFTLSMAPLLCDCNCMFDHVTGHITEHTRNKLWSGTVLEQPPSPPRAKHLYISHTVSNNVSSLFNHSFCTDCSHLPVCSCNTYFNTSTSHCTPDSCSADIFVLHIAHGIHACSPQVHAHLGGFRSLLSAPPLSLKPVKLISRRRLKHEGERLKNLTLIFMLLQYCNIYLYKTHYCCWYLCESVASNLARHSAIYQRRHEMRISEGISLGDEVTGGL